MLEKGQYSWLSLMAQLVKNSPAMWETWVPSLGWEDPLEKGKLPTPVFYLENSMDSIVHGVTKHWTGLKDFQLLTDFIGHHGCPTERTSR